MPSTINRSLTPFPTWSVRALLDRVLSLPRSLALSLGFRRGSVASAGGPSKHQVRALEFSLQLSSWALYRSPVSVAQKDTSRHRHLLLGSIDGYTSSYVRPYRADPKRARANPTRSDAAHARLGGLGPDPRRARLRSRFSLPQNPTSAGSWYRRRRSQFCALSDP